MSGVPRLIVVQQSCLWWRQWMSSYSTFLQQHQASQNKSPPLGIAPVCCWPMPCNWSCRVVMMMMQSGLLGARLKAPPLALSPTSPMGLDLKQLPSLQFTISCLFVSWSGQSQTRGLFSFQSDSLTFLTVYLPPVLSLFFDHKPIHIHSFGEIITFKWIQKRFPSSLESMRYHLTL